MIDFVPYASGSSGNLYTANEGKSPLIIECGLPWKAIQRKLNFKTSDYKGCLLTHSHGDHSRAVKDLIKNGIDCYMSQGTAESLNLAGHRVKVIRPKQQFEVGTWTIMPFTTEHDCEGSLGFLLANQKRERLLFATDTYYVKYKFQDLMIIAVECNYALDILRENVEAGTVDPSQKNRILKSHFSLENVKEFLRANDLSQVREIHLIHLSDDNSDAERFKREIMELTGKPVYIG